MDLRDRVAEAIGKHEPSPTKALLILTDVMGVVEPVIHDLHATILRHDDANDSEVNRLSAHVRELEEKNRQLSEQADLWKGRVDRLEDVNRTVREARDRERLDAALSRAREIAREEA